VHRGCAFLKNHDDRPEAAKVRRWLDNMARDGKIVKTKHANPESCTRNARCFIGTPAFDEIPAQIQPLSRGASTPLPVRPWASRSKLPVQRRVSEIVGYRNPMLLISLSLGSLNLLLESAP